MEGLDEGTWLIPEAQLETPSITTQVKVKGRVGSAECQPLGPQMGIRIDRLSSDCACPPEGRQNGLATPSNRRDSGGGHMGRESASSRTTWWPLSWHTWPQVCEALTSLPIRHDSAPLWVQASKLDREKQRVQPNPPGSEGEEVLPLKVTLRRG